MKSSYFILSPTIEYYKISNILQSKFTDHIQTEGFDYKWARISLLFDGKRLTLSSMVRERPGDRFSKLVLSMHNFFRTIPTPAASNKSQILKTIENVKMMVGLVAEPEFADDDFRLDCVWEIAECIHAFVFDGESMLDLQGQRLLSRNGEYDVLV